MTGAVTFNTNSLQTYNPITRTGIITDEIDLDSIAPQDLTVYPLAHSNASAIPFGNTPSKVIPVTGTIAAATSAALDALLNTFKGYFRGTNKNLDIEYNGSTIRFIATQNGVSIKRSKNKKMATFTINFLCTPPFGTDINNTTALNAAGRTNNVYSDTHTFIGTAEYQLPVVTITLTAVSAAGSQQLFWGNNDTGQGITITRTGWTAGDVVVIDASDPLNQKVTVNGTPVDFSGAFPEFTPGLHTMTYADSFTSRTMSHNVVYKARYM
jgi:hypothetical protein